MPVVSARAIFKELVAVLTQVVPFHERRSPYAAEVMVPKRAAPVPLSSERRAASLAEVSREVEEILLLKTDQSLEVRRPRAEAEAEGKLKVRVAPEPVIAKSVPLEEEATVRAPVSAEPNCGVIEVTPALFEEIAQPPSASSKQPAVRWMPPVLLKVVVPVVKLMPLVFPTESRVPGVEVPMPENALVEVATMFWKTPCPATERVAYGEVVPMPTEPETMRPLEGAVLTPAYEPTASAPFTSSAFFGAFVLNPLKPVPRMKSDELMLLFASNTMLPPDPDWPPITAGKAVPKLMVLAVLIIIPPCAYVVPETVSAVLDAYGIVLCALASSARMAPAVPVELVATVVREPVPSQYANCPIVPLPESPPRLAAERQVPLIA